MAKKKTATTENTENKRENTEIKSASSPKHSVSSVVARNQELEDMLRRTLADYQNLERRIEEERKQLSKLSSLLLIEKLLPILDNLENAQAHLNDAGLQIVIKQFKDVLESEGLEDINAQGAQFDPNFHEAVEIKEGEADNKIVKVLVKGYTIEGKTIRPAKVVVERRADSGQVIDRESQAESAGMTEDHDQILDQVENDTVGGDV